jgi:hypothetical protein
MILPATKWASSMGVPESSIYNGGEQVTRIAESKYQNHPQRTQNRN